MTSIGIDFGTSNCSAHIASSLGVAPIKLDGDEFALPSVVFTSRREVAMRQIEEAEYDKRLRSARAEQSRNKAEFRPVTSDEQLKKAIKDALRREAANEANKAYWDQTFFSMLKSGQAMLFGTPALHAYFADPLSGVLVKSPKSFLGSDIREEYVARFEDVVAAMLGHIKKIAETTCDYEITCAVLGRPVRYHGRQGEKGNAQALNVMKRAAARAGFRDVRFELEPLAAAYEYEATIPDEKTILVVDVGGGTTDCVMVRVSPVRAKKLSRDEDILGVSGDRVGGTDFDEAVAWSSFMPAFGKDSLTKSRLPIPHSVLRDAISIRNVPAQLRFSSARPAIEELKRQATSPDKLERLLTLHREQLQYRLIHSAEMGKIKLSKQRTCTVPLKYIELGFAISLDRDALIDASSTLVDRIRALAAEAIAAAGVKPDEIFLTGGMALSPIVSEAIARLGGKNIPIRSSDMLGTVGKGLGLCAQRTFEH